MSAAAIIAAIALVAAVVVRAHSRVGVVSVERAALLAGHAVGAARAARRAAADAVAAGAAARRFLHHIFILKMGGNVAVAAASVVATAVPSAVAVAAIVAAIVAAVVATIVAAAALVIAVIPAATSVLLVEVSTLVVVVAATGARAVSVATVPAALLVVARAGLFTGPSVASEPAFGWFLARDADGLSAGQIRNLLVRRGEGTVDARLGGVSLHLVLGGHLYDPQADILAVERLIEVHQPILGCTPELAPCLDPFLAITARVCLVEPS